MDLLLQLGEPAEGLCDDFLAHARTKLEDDLANLTKLAEAAVGSGEIETLDQNLWEETADTDDVRELSQQKESCDDIKYDGVAMVGNTTPCWPVLCFGIMYRVMEHMQIVKGNSFCGGNSDSMVNG